MKTNLEEIKEIVRKLFDAYEDAVPSDWWVDCDKLFDELRSKLGLKGTDDSANK